MYDDDQAIADGRLYRVRRDLSVTVVGIYIYTIVVPIRFIFFLFFDYFRYIVLQTLIRQLLVEDTSPTIGTVWNERTNPSERK